MRVFLFNVFAIWLTSAVYPAFIIRGSWTAILFAGFILSVLMIVVKPILKILLIPINILTLGLLSWFINVIVIYILTVLVPEIDITAWTFPGLRNELFSLGKIHLPYVASLVIVSFMLTFISNALHNISEG